MLNKNFVRTCMIERAVTRCFPVFLFFRNIFFFFIYLFSIGLWRIIFLLFLFNFPLNDANTMTTDTITSATYILFLYQDTTKSCFTFFIVYFHEKLHLNRVLSNEIKNTGKTGTDSHEYIIHKIVYRIFRNLGRVFYVLY